MMEPITRNWLDENGNHDGGISTGIGFTIAWQRGPLTDGRNGAFLIEVLKSCRQQLIQYQLGKFACKENQEALDQLNQSIASLEKRAARRMAEGKLGTHEV